MDNKRRVKLLKSDRGQTVQIPPELELPGEHAIMWIEKGKLVIEPAPSQSLLALLATLQPIEEDLAEIENVLPDISADR